MTRREREDVENAIDRFVREGVDPGELREWLLEALRRATERTAPWDNEDTADQAPRAEDLRASRVFRRRGG